MIMIGASQKMCQSEKPTLSYFFVCWKPFGRVRVLLSFGRAAKRLEGCDHSLLTIGLSVKKVFKPLFIFRMDVEKVYAELSSVLLANHVANGS